jgi:uncharacterized membrane protein YfcA
MYTSEILGFFLALLVGISLGLIGSGGSILSVPILVYILKIDPVLATAYSLFIVGVTSLVGGFKKWKEDLVDFQKVLLFGIPTVVGVFMTRAFIIPIIPTIIKINDSFSFPKSLLIMVIFAIVMLVASIKMIRPIQELTQDSLPKLKYKKIIIFGLIIGIIAGFVGAGGGFLIIPALLQLTKIPIKKAIGTSLFIVATQSLIGFLGDLNHGMFMDWSILIPFTGFSLIGFFLGNLFSKKIPGEKLKVTFGFLVFFM